MMNYKKRASRLGAIAGLGLFAATSAHAYTMQVGGWDIQIDTTASVGVSMLTTDTDTRFLPTNNGGPADISTYIRPDANAPFALCSSGGLSAANQAYGTFCQEATGSEVYNFDGAINTDDGRLNFNSSGDLISAPFKITSDFEAKMGMTTAFMRVNAYYDAVLMDDGSFKRDGVDGGLTDRGEDNTGFDIQLLDAYVSWDFDVADRPMMVRVGKQVINWGEATFIPGGNSAFSPIDVAAIRRPGAEIKEALLPVEAIYASIALTDTVSVEAYVGGWDEYKLDVGGTAFASSDAFVQGTKGGNGDYYYVGGGPTSGQRFNCGSAADLTAAGMGTTILVRDAIAATGVVDCDANSDMDVLNNITSNAEYTRDNYGDTNRLSNDDDIEGNDSIGLALRWYAEDLNSTEFGFYYQRMDSRLPYVSYKTYKQDVTYEATGYSASTVSRGVGMVGCAASMVTNLTTEALAGTYGGRAYRFGYENIAIDDTYDLISTIKDNFAAAGTPALKAYRDAYIGTLGLDAATTAALTGTPVVLDAADNTIGALQEAMCLTYALQLDATQTLDSSFDAFGQLPTGAALIKPTWNYSLFAEFPEVTTYGFSFNTTVLGWGLQGDFTYRPDVPLQIDTDVLTITALFNNCAFTTTGIVENTYITGSTYDAEFGGVGCQESSYVKGYVDDHDAITWDIGTTATFTASNPVVSALGANIGILLTEFQGLIVDDIEERRADTGVLGNAGNAPLVNTCTAGSDLPLNGILSIDSRKNTSTAPQPIGYCRPTDESAGMVLLGRLQYDNIFGTPIAVAPTLVISHGLQGMSPSPIGQWRQGAGSAAVSLDFTYLSKWQAGISYRMYHGDAVRTKNIDRDHVSLSVSYAF